MQQMGKQQQQQQHRQHRQRRGRSQKPPHSVILFLVALWPPFLLMKSLDGYYHGFIISACHGFSTRSISSSSYLSSHRRTTVSSVRQAIRYDTPSPSIRNESIMTAAKTAARVSSTSLFLSSSYQTKDGSRKKPQKYKKHYSKNITEKQRENESQLQYLSKSGKTQQALTFYNGIWNEYNAWQQQQQDCEIEGEKSGTSMKSPPAPTVRLMNHAIDACARARPNPLTSEAMQIFTSATAKSTEAASETSNSNSKKNQMEIRLVPNVYTFGSLIRAYARIGNIQKCQQILNDMKKNYNIVPNSVIYSTIISACEHVDNDPENVNVKKALTLFQEAIDCNNASNKNTNNGGRSGKNMDMNIFVYNTVLSVFAKGGEWKLACQLIDEMEGSWCSSNNNKHIVPPSVNIPPPDHITYGTVMAACERAKQWSIVLKIAERVNKHHYYQLDGISISSALKACQQLGLADDALKYLDQMKELNSEAYRNSSSDSISSSSNSGHNHRRKPLQGPDSVAYRLAISACARSGYMENKNGKTDEGINSSSNSNSRGPRWIDGIRLLREMEQVTGSAPDVIAYTAAIGGCATAGEYKRAIQLLKEMKRKGVEPNVVTFTAVISACASACAKRLDDFDEDNLMEENLKQNELHEATVSAAMKASLALLSHMTKVGNGIEPNIVTYNAAIRVCAEAMNTSKAFALLEELKARNLEPTIVTYGTLMTACERVGDVEGATTVFRFMRDADMQPNEIIYGAAISCFRKASDAGRTFRLLNKMLTEKLTPNTATFNTVLMSQTETKNIKNAMAVYDLMKLSSPAPQYGRPNNQTYNMLIRCMAMNSEPAKAEYFLNEMRQNGMKPDVDLFTMTVTAYEKNVQPRKALSLMESMREEGYDFYDIKVLDAAFKQGVKIINNVVGNGQNDQATTKDNRETSPDSETLGGTWYNKSDFA